jgi:hypothetical protein
MVFCSPTRSSRVVESAWVTLGGHGFPQGGNYNGSDSEGWLPFLRFYFRTEQQFGSGRLPESPQLPAKTWFSWTIDFVHLKNFDRNTH